jgi:DNA primase
VLDIEKILIDSGVEFSRNPNNPNEITMRCFSGEHEDSNPSLSYNIEKGLYNCFACGFSGNTEKLATLLGVKHFVAPLTKQGFKIQKLKDKLSDIKLDKRIYMPEPRINYLSEFKGVSEKTIQRFGAFVTEYEGLQDYICFPIYQNNKLRFIEGRYKVVDADRTIPKYMRKPANVNVSDVLFPLDFVQDFSRVILVEGLFDVINLHDLGFNSSLCIFGTNNFSTKKAKVLDDFGCTEVIIMMDGDLAGRTAATKIQRILEQRSIASYIIDLPDGKDPGNLTPEEAAEYLGDFFID